VSDPERNNYDEDFAKGPKYPFAMTVAVWIWMNGGIWMAGFGIKYLIDEIINRRLDTQTVAFSLLWYLAGIMIAIDGGRCWLGKAQTTRRLFFSSVVLVVLCCLGLLAKAIQFLSLKKIGPPPPQKPFDHDLFPLLLIGGLSYFTVVLVRQGSAEYRIWKKFQIEKEQSKNL